MKTLGKNKNIFFTSARGTTRPSALVTPSNFDRKKSERFPKFTSKMIKIWFKIPVAYVCCPVRNSNPFCTQKYVAET
jgi:hypothetical protein